MILLGIVVFAIPGTSYVPHENLPTKHVFFDSENAGSTWSSPVYDEPANALSNIRPALPMDTPAKHTSQFDTERKIRHVVRSLTQERAHGNADEVS